MSGTVWYKHQQFTAEGIEVQADSMWAVIALPGFAKPVRIGPGNYDDISGHDVTLVKNGTVYTFEEYERALAIGNRNVNQVKREREEHGMDGPRVKRSNEGRVARTDSMTSHGSVGSQFSAELEGLSQRMDFVQQEVKTVMNSMPTRQEVDSALSVTYDEQQQLKGELGDLRRKLETHDAENAGWRTELESTHMAVKKVSADQKAMGRNDE